MQDVLFAFLLTLFAGLFTTVGGLLALFPRKNNYSFLAACLSFSAGVMIYISFIEIFRKAVESLETVYIRHGYSVATTAFFAGILLIAAIDKIVPSPEDSIAALHAGSSDKALHRTGLMSALSIAVHNFPEGLITFMAAMTDPSLGIAIAAAVAIHNIPEGIAVAAPIYYSTGSRRKALLYSAGSGLSEPVGGLCAYLFLSQAANGGLFGKAFAVVGGIMVYISLQQLLPAAILYSGSGRVIKWSFFGMAVMALSLVLL
jgi:ZIP family zinc transporter